MYGNRYILALIVNAVKDVIMFMNSDRKIKSTEAARKMDVQKPSDLGLVDTVVLRKNSWPEIAGVTIFVS